MFICIRFVEILWKKNEPGFRKTDGYPGTRDVTTRRLRIERVGSDRVYPQATRVLDERGQSLGAEVACEAHSLEDPGSKPGMPFPFSFFF